MEAALRRAGKDFGNTTLDEMEELWQQAKKAL